MSSLPINYATSRLFVIFLFLLVFGSVQAATFSNQAKQNLFGKKTSDYFLVLPDLDLSQLKQRKLKRSEIVDGLIGHARKTQAPIIRQLQDASIPYKSYWLKNRIWLKADAAFIRQLARHKSIVSVYANQVASTGLPVAQRSGKALAALAWGIGHIGADNLWAQNIRGQGVVIAILDTGVDWQHEALLESYRGGINNHAYHWHDAISASTVDCPGNSAMPCDDNGHGTHVAGTAAGSDQLATAIGVAPDAKWIACRNMNYQGAGTPASYLECFQWAMAPTDASGQNPRPDLGADIINNSWTCPASEGCLEWDHLKGMVDTLYQAGIFVVSAAGNSGPNCHTISDQPATYFHSFAVGAIDSNSQIAWFSSRGTVTAGGQNLIKPDVVAPGELILSSIPGNGYANNSGTSMAAPHVSGLAALMISANPWVRHRPDVLTEALHLSATPALSVQDCGGVSGQQSPNTVFGYGMADGLSSKAWLDMEKIFGDHFEY